MAHENQPQHVIPVNPDALSSQWTCPICLNVPLRPVLTWCQHLFCHDCMVRCRASGAGRHCPTCRADNPQAPLELKMGSFLRRLWSDIQVRCGNCDNGCLWTGSISKATSHLNVCKAESMTTQRPPADIKAETAYETVIETLSQIIRDLSQGLAANESDANALRAENLELRSQLKDMHDQWSK
jgi:hypothetical protein